MQELVYYRLWKFLYIIYFLKGCFLGLYPNVEELRQNYLKITAEPEFQAEFDALLKEYVGRPTPLYFAKRLSEQYNTKIYLKREDLCHTGAHKVNNTSRDLFLDDYIHFNEISKRV